MGSPCGGCAAHCCFDYTVTITGYDVWRIAVGLRLPLEAFVAPLRTTQSPPGAFRLDATDRELVLALRRRGPDDERARACVFWLALPEGGGRCGIHEQRPNVCRVYPAYLRDDTVHLRPDAKCPPRSWMTPDMELPAWRRDLRRHRMDEDIYGLFVERWNRQMDTVPEGRAVPLESYLAHLMDFYTRLAEIRRQAGDDDDLLARWSRRTDHGRTPGDAEASPDDPYGRFVRAVSAALPAG